MPLFDDLWGNNDWLLFRSTLAIQNILTRSREVDFGFLAIACRAITLVASSLPENQSNIPESALSNQTGPQTDDSGMKEVPKEDRSVSNRCTAFHLPNKKKTRPCPTGSGVFSADLQTYPWMKL